MNCPACGATNAKKAPGPGQLGCSLIVFASLIIWIPILGWILAPIMVLVGIIGIAVAFFAPKSPTATFTCSACQHSFEAPYHAN